MRGATNRTHHTNTICNNFNPRAPCGARLSTIAPTKEPTQISIHAPHAGRDNGAYAFIEPILKFQSTRPMRGATAEWCRSSTPGTNFNPRAPCGARPLLLRFARLHLIFQSTRPMRGATMDEGRGIRTTYDFNPRAPCGARLPLNPILFFSWIFQSTRPMRGATSKDTQSLTNKTISIHAPHAGRDSKSI